ncbi:MAG: glycoside hydrolase N-terminal domain-containing protein [Candidatus Omnitrophota bacterium]
MKYNNILYFDKPPGTWIEGLPLGNGKIGAMVMGYAAQERICLNHEGIWRKITERKTVPVSHYLPRIRKLLRQGKWEQAGRLVGEKFQPLSGGEKQGNSMEEYQPACDLVFKMDNPFPVEKYRRILDLSQGFVKVFFSMGKVRYERICFVSAEDNIFVMQIKADHKKSISSTVWLERENSPECSLANQANNDRLVLKGDIENGTSFEVKGKVICKGGTVSTSSDNKKLVISGADEMLILTEITINGKNKDTEKISLVAEDVDVLLKKHVRNHNKIYRRVLFSLKPHKKEETLTTDRLLHNAFIGKPGNKLFELMFNMGRYLMITSSRPGTKAISLQGIWNNKMHPPWQSDWHLDMNVQMAYWIAENGNLSEFSWPLFDLATSLIPEGERNASNLFGCRGVVFPIAFAGEGKMLPGPWVIWTGAAGWLAQHFWWHYEYTLERSFLQDTAYPYLKKVADFYEDFLVKDPSGRYEVSPSLSPENTPLERGGWEGHKMICVNATMDLAIIKELFGNLLKAGKILDRDSEKRKTWQEILDNLPEWPIDKNGVLKEWADKTNLDNHQHRHFSHLYPLFPGDMFSREETPELVNAAARALSARQAGGYADNAGWSYPYLALFHARLGQGNRALKCLNYLAKSCMMDNLLTIHNDWRSQGLSLYWEMGDRAFMIDAILGASAAMAEMLLQSHGGLIRILPALPKAWADKGEIKGLRARGGFEVSMRWKAGTIEQVTIHSLCGQSCYVKLCRRHRDIKLRCGRNPIKTAYIKGNQVQFKTETGRTYQLF